LVPWCRAIFSVVHPVRYRKRFGVLVVLRAV